MLGIPRLPKKKFRVCGPTHSMGPGGLYTPILRYMGPPSTIKGVGLQAQKIFREVMEVPIDFLKGF